MPAPREPIDRSVRQRRKAYRDYDDDEDPHGEELAAVNDRLDALSRQLERMVQMERGAPRTASASIPHPAPFPVYEPPARELPPPAPAADHVAEALARLDRRLDQVIAEARAVATERHARPAAPQPQVLPQVQVQAPPPPVSYAPRAAAYTPPPAPGPANWAAEISARQRALEGGAPAPVAAPMPAQSFAPPPSYAPEPERLPPMRMAPPAPDLSGLETQLRQITEQIASLQRPYEDGVGMLRSDLAEIGRALTDAMPRHAIEALENEVRALAERIDHSRQAGVDASTLASLEHGIADIRDALHHLTPAESLVGFDDAIRGLSQKIDQIGYGGQDPTTVAQLEQAIGQMRSLVSHVASDGALEQLAAEVRGMAARLEHIAADSSAEALNRMEHRITALMDSGRSSLPSDLDLSIRALSERLDRIQQAPQSSASDKLALGSLEDRIVSLAEKLDASHARFGNLGAIERGIADLLVYLEDMRSAGARGPRMAAPAEQPAPPLPPVAPQLHVPVPAPTPAPAPIAQPIAPPPVEIAPQRAQARPAPVEPRRPINAGLSPDTPLEPGAGMPRSTPVSAAARIAASEAALNGVRPASPGSSVKAAAIAAARNAAKSAYAAVPPMAAKNTKAEATPQFADGDVPVIAMRQRILKHGKTLLVAASVVVIVLGALQAGMEFFLPANPPANPAATTTAPATVPSEATPATPPAANQTPARPMPTPDSGRSESAPPEVAPSGQLSPTPSPFDPSTILAPKPPSDVTGSISKPHTTRAPTAHTSVASADNLAAALPATFGPALRTAAATNNPAADYEIAMRYTEGRGVAQNSAEAARWLERAAATGFAPAEFQLASMYEKGDGLKKDLQSARRLYISAAEKGHAKAMHNLAVLYAEGIDGKPDYKVASEWFRKAAAYGVADSQYNLAILYARGIGVSLNLAESYKWFALAARNGDHEAAKKRDEVASRLDQQTLNAAKLAVQTFTLDREPEAATDLRVPAGGWDKAAATPTNRPKTRSRTADKS